MNKLLTTLALVYFLSACSNSQPSDNQSDNYFKASGYAEPLEQESFDQLSPLDQYTVANKLLGFMQKGIAVDEFFDLSQGVDNLVVKETNFINDMRQKLATPLDIDTKNDINDAIYGIDPETGIADDAFARFKFTVETEPKLLPMAQIMDYPISRDMFAIWMTHFLANTILFSPAYEMPTTDEVDIARVMNFLELEILASTPANDIIYKFLPNLSRWRVSRSPENHALEAFENYLGIFDAEDEAIKGGIACQEYYLTQPEAGYQLRKKPVVNTEPLIFFDTYVATTCDDFYQVVAYHPVTLTRVVEVIVNYFMDGRSREDRLAMVSAVVDSNAETFEEIFLSILFSKEFLLNTENPISIENNVMGLYQRLKADRVASANFNSNLFLNLVGVDDESTRYHESFNMSSAGWATSDYKLGRYAQVPVDTLSFTNYMKTIRNGIVASINDWVGGVRRFNNSPNSPYSNHVGFVYQALDSDANGSYDTTQTRPEIAALSLSEFIDYVYMTGMSRKAIQEEKELFVQFFALQRWASLNPDTNEYEINQFSGTSYHGVIAQALLDFMSRLPEFYYYKQVAE